MLLSIECSGVDHLQAANTGGQSTHAAQSQLPQHLPLIAILGFLVVACVMIARSGGITVPEVRGHAAPPDSNDEEDGLLQEPPPGRSPPPRPRFLEVVARNVRADSGLSPRSPHTPKKESINAIDGRVRRRSVDNV
jgi:hypothetical protein